MMSSRQIVADQMNQLRAAASKRISKGGRLASKYTEFLEEGQALSKNYAKNLRNRKYAGKKEAKDVQKGLDKMVAGSTREGRRIENELQREVTSAHELELSKLKDGDKVLRMRLDQVKKNAKEAQKMKGEMVKQTFGAQEIVNNQRALVQERRQEQDQADMKNTALRQRRQQQKIKKGIVSEDKNRKKLWKANRKKAKAVQNELGEWVQGAAALQPKLAEAELAGEQTVSSRA